jgi:Fe-S cluster biogenesis protein NfuA
MTIDLQAMPTPNPNTIKFLLNVEFLESGSIDFQDAAKAELSPLPKALFEIDGIQGVMVGTNFVSITKSSEAGWETVLEASSDLIKELAEQDNLLEPALVEKAQEKGEEDNEIVAKIKHILDTEIRPAIAMDGGDCSFEGFEDGVVTLALQGACSSCPSATLTLKMGIEGRLKEEIPEVTEVVQV